MEWQIIFNAIEDPAMILDLNSHILEVNKATLTTTKLPAAELVNRPCYEIFHKQWTRPSDCPVRNLLISEKPQTCAMQVEAFCKIFKVTVSPILNSAGKIDKILHIARDITRQVLAEDLLKQSECKYKALYSNAPLSYQSLNEDGCFIDVNPSWLRTLGYKLEEVIGKWFGDFLHPDSKLHFEKNFSAFKKRGTVHGVQFKIRHKDGHYLDISFEGCIGYASDGDFQQTYCVFQDISERKHAEKELIINKQRLQLALEGADLGMWDWDLRRNETYFSPRYLSMLGYGPTELPHTLATWENLLHPEDKASAKQQIMTSIEKGSGQWVIEFRLQHKNGQYLWILGRGKIVAFSQNGTPLRAAGTHMDITSRKIGEEKLRDREERFRELFNNMSSGVAIYEAFGKGNDFIFKDLNRAGMLSSQIELREIVGRKVSEIFPNIKEMGLFDVFQRVYKTGIPEHLPSSLYSDDRLTLWVDNYVCKIPSGEIVAIYNDITDRKNNESELVKNRALLNAIIENLPFDFFALDITGHYIMQNSSCRRNWGDIIGKSLKDLKFDKKTITLWLENNRKAYSGETIESEISLDSADGEKTYYNIVSPIKDSDKVIGLLGLNLDISERKRMEEELLKVRKLESVGVLAGGIAHDFNNILAAILGNISLALTITDPKDETYELLVESEKASLRAKDLTRQLLTFAKGGEPVKKIAAIGEVIKDSAEFVLRGSNVRCNFKFDEDLWPLAIDTGQISQVVQNIIVNANQAMPSGGTITIDGLNYCLKSSGIIPVSLGNYIKIIIKDQGIGIRADMLDKIFDPYFTTKQAGNGLGLAITHSIICKHDGYIDVDSELGQGTTFTIYLPASIDRLELDQKNVTEPSTTGHGRVMIMDDEEMIRSLVGKALSRIGYEVVSAKDGDEAVRLYQESKAAGAAIDLIIMDLTIPGGMGGKDTIKEIHKIDSEAKVLVSSGYANDPVMANFSEYGFCGAIAKPFQMRELLEIVGITVSS